MGSNGHDGPPGEDGDIVISGTGIKGPKGTKQKQIKATRTNVLQAHKDHEVPKARQAFPESHPMCVASLVAWARADPMARVDGYEGVLSYSLQTGTFFRMDHLANKDRGAFQENPAHLPLIVHLTVVSVRSSHHPSLNTHRIVHF